MTKDCQVCGQQMQGHKNKKYCCMRCSRAASRPRTRNDLSNLKGSLKRKGLTLKTYLAMLDLQEHRCAICRNSETAVINNKIKRLAVDHCHETNQVRGLLCQRCNLMLGHVGDNWLLLDNAEEYLAYWHVKHRSSKVQSHQEAPLLN